MELDNQITELKKATEILKSDVIPTVLTTEYIADIEKFAAKVRTGLKKVDDESAVRRKVMLLLRT